MGMTKKPFVHPLRDSLTPADLRLRPLLGAFRTSGAVPSGLFSHPHFCHDHQPEMAIIPFFVRQSTV